MDEEEQVARTRGALAGPWRTVEKVVLCLISVLGALYALGVPQYLKLAVFVEQYAGLMLGLLLFATLLSTTAFTRSRTSAPSVLSILSAFTGLATGLYVAVMFPAIIVRAGFISPVNVALGLAALVLVLEATRRSVGGILLIVTSSMAVYALFSHLFPGHLKVPAVPWTRLVNYLYLDNNALFGLPLAVTLDTVLPFILFGSFLFSMGGGEFFVDLAMALFGRYRGGPAKVAVVASGCFGTISGSAVANVMVDGWITIPMMVRVGYPPPMAAAIEAIASTGGQLMPPVMGLTAFLIAEFLNVPYAEVALAALIPALLYYICIFVQIDREAAKRGIVGVPAAEVPRLGRVMKRGWIFVVPLAVIVYALFYLNVEPGKAGMWAVLATFAISMMKKESRRKLKDAGVSILESAGRTVAQLGLITAMAGLIVGLASVSGLGSILSMEIIRYGGANPLLLLVFVAGVCLILGMGMPTAAAYMLLAIIVVPSLVQAGMLPMAAHLFVFYFGAISMITPPVALAAFAAASIIGASPMQTGYSAFRLGLLAYVVPFIFAFSPELLMVGSPWRVVIAFVTAVAGAMLIGTGVVGYATDRMNWVARALALLAGVALVLPPGGGVPYGTLLNVAGGVIGLALFFSGATMKLLPRLMPEKRTKGVQ